MSRIGHERGWPPLARAQFDAGASPRGHLMLGSPDDVAAKILAQHAVFGHDRYLMQMKVGQQDHAAILRSIELFGTVVAPKVRAEIARRKASEPRRGAENALAAPASLLPAHAERGSQPPEGRPHMTERIGFIGVGLMGHGMAKNLVEKGFPLTVLAHNKREAVDDLVKRGAREAKSVREVAEASDAVVLCVTGSPQVEAVVAGLASAGKPLLIVDCSTSEPASTRRLAAELQPQGHRLRRRAAVPYARKTRGRARST